MVGEKPGFASMCAALPGGGFALPSLQNQQFQYVIRDPSIYENQQY